MQSYLVMLVHDMDDLPVGLFEHQDEARAFAMELEPMPTPYLRDVFRTDCSTPNCVKLVTFDGGFPVSSVVVKGFDDEQ